MKKRIDNDKKIRYTVNIVRKKEKTK